MSSAGPRPGGALGGAALIVLAGIALGLGANALARSARPPRGLPWIARADTLASLEAWSHPARAGSGEAAAPRPGGRAAAPPSPGTPDPGAARVQEPPAVAPRAGARAAALPPDAAARTPAPETQAPSPAGATPPPPQRPQAEDVVLPPVPDSDQPIQVQLETFKRFFDAHAATIVDAREAAEYAQGHVAGALSIPAEEASAHLEMLGPLKSAGRPIVVYCSGPGCDLSKQLATLMLSEGIRKVLVFEGGFPAWQGAGYPVERGAAK